MQYDTAITDSRPLPGPSTAAPVSATPLRIREDETLGAGTNVRLSVYDSDRIREAIENWDDLTSDKHRVFALHIATDRGLLSPRRSWSHNTTSRDVHELICHNLSPGTAEPFVIDELSVGTGTTAPQVTDRSLEASIGSTEIAVSDVASNTLYVNTFIGSGEFNGNTIRELGLFANTRMVNRALITATAKDPTKTLTIEVELTIIDISEA